MEVLSKWSIPSMRYPCKESWYSCIHHLEMYVCFDEYIRRLRPRLHGSGQIFARTKTCTVPPCVYTGPAELDEYLNG